MDFTATKTSCVLSAVSTISAGLASNETFTIVILCCNAMLTIANTIIEIYRNFKKAKREEEAKDKENKSNGND